jgi:hypothetical protein
MSSERTGILPAWLYYAEGVCVSPESGYLLAGCLGGNDVTTGRH